MSLKPTLRQMFNLKETDGMEPPADRDHGWKPDPGNPAQYRWWNGSAWTEHTGGSTGQPAPDPSAPVPSAVGAEADPDAKAKADIEAAAQRMKLKIGAKRELERLPQILGPEESVLELARGTYGSRVGLIVLTDQRILFYNDGWTGSANQDIHLSDARAVSVAGGIVYSHVRIEALTKSVIIAKVMKEDAIRIVNAARQIMNALKTPSSPMETQGLIDAAAEKSPMEQLRQLGELRDAGVVSEEEFEAKKAELLGRI